MNTKSGKPETLQQAIQYFADRKTCLDFVVGLRWPQGVVCPTCGSAEVSFLATRRVWKCKTRHARQQFSVKVGTIFEDSPIGLEKWLPAMWMLVNSKNGISSYEVGRALGVTQKTAWFMLHRIRLATQTGTFAKLRGTVEVDETYIGGQARWMSQKRMDRLGVRRGRHMFTKAIVLGMVGRSADKQGSQARAMVVPNVRRGQVRPHLDRTIEAGAHLISDEHTAYQGLEKQYRRDVIRHAYVRGHVHINSVENFWGLLKRAIRGTYISVEPFHLFRYVDEQVYGRKGTDRSRFVGAVRAILGKRLTYKGLIGAGATT
jgi:transposase-like protein